MQGTVSSSTLQVCVQIPGMSYDRVFDSLIDSVAVQQHGEDGGAWSYAPPSSPTSC